MSRAHLTSLDLAKNELQNAAIQSLAAAPSSPVAGQLYFDTSTTPGVLYWYSGSGWVAAKAGTGGGTVTSVGATGPLTNTGTAVDPVVALKTGSLAGAANGVSNTHIASDAAIALAKLATDPLARANHTGTQMAASVSDFDTQVRTSRLDQLAAPVGSINANSQKVIALLDPTGAQDAATKGYVDTVAAGLAPKDAVRAATTANGALTTAFANGSVLDGVTLVTGDRVLLKNQTAAAENGIYTVNATGAPTRTTDADSSGDLVGAAVFVSEGTTNGNTLWVMTSDAPITVGTTALVWSQFGGPGAFTAGTGLALTGTVFSLTSPVTVALGGTNATTAPAARTSLGVGIKPIAFNVGDGAALAYALVHNFGTRDVLVSVYRATTPWDTVTTDEERTDVNTVTLRFPTAPAANAYRAVIAAAA